MAETLFEELVAAGLPVFEADESGYVGFEAGVTLTEEQDALRLEITMKHLDPSWERPATLKDTVEALLQAAEGKPEKLDTIKARRKE